MQHPQVVFFDRDGHLADLVRPLATAERWVVREPRQVDPLWRTLLTGGPTVLVLRFGSLPDRDLALIERVSWELPDVAIIAVGDVEGPEALVDLAWDLGAAFVLFPPLSRDLLPEIVVGLMRRAIQSTVGPISAVPKV